MVHNRFLFVIRDKSPQNNSIRVLKSFLGSVLLCLMVSSATVLKAAPAQLPAQQPTTAQLELSYGLYMKRPTTHLLQVAITVKHVTGPFLKFAIPVWAPGRYAVYDFAKNVQQFTASDASGQTLPWTQPNLQTWTVNTSNCGGTVEVHYKVFANDLTGSFSQFDTSHGAINGASVFMYLKGHKPNPLTLTIHPPQGWKIISGFSMSLTQTTFHIPNYDILVDTPLEISPYCWVDDFEEDGKTFRVAVHTYGQEVNVTSNRAALVNGLKKIVRSEMAMMPEPDFKHYTFIFHFDPDIRMGDGMEHLNSTDIIIRGRLSGIGLSEALETAAHEFFHLWNVKRLRPVGLGPFTYSKPVLTRSLWFVEGVTTYYSYVNLLRAGIWTRQQFLNRMGDEIRTLQGEPGRKLMSAESSSFHAWFYDRSPQMQETNFANSTISYYNKGALLGMLLDLEIREKTHDQKSLDNVMRYMYRKYYEGPPTSYYLRGRGYTEKDILDAVNHVSGADFTSFFKQYIAGVVPLPYNRIFAKAGLVLHIATLKNAPPSLGATVVPVDTGVKIFAIRPGSPADRAGLSRDDILLSVDSQSLATDSLSDRLSIYPPGAKALFEVERHEKRHFIYVKLGPPRPDEYSIQDLPGATQEEVQIRRGWLAEGQQESTESSAADHSAIAFRRVVPAS